MPRSWSFSACLRASEDETETWPSDGGMIEKGRRDGIAPGSIEVVGSEEARRRVCVERIGIGPVLVHAAPGVLPVVEDVAAELVATDAPDMSVALRLQVVVTDHHVVDVLDLEGQVIEPVLLALNAEQDMVVDIGVAAVQAIERADQIVRASGIDLIRHQKAERV